MVKTALILVDTQNAFCSRDGSYWKRGGSILNLNRVLRVTKSLLNLARQNNWVVIFIRMAFKADYSDAGLLIKKYPAIAKFQGYIENTWDSEIILSLKPQKHEEIITKKRYDPFCNTNLKTILTNNRIQRVVVAGLLTNVCVESCVRSACDRNFEVIVVKDGTATYSKKFYKSSLTTMERYFAKVVDFCKLKTLVNSF